MIVWLWNYHVGPKGGDAMRKISFCAWGLLALGTVVCCVGCQKAGRERTYPVTGTVTQDGVAVAGAVVAFHPSNGGRSASGVTDASGRYKLTTWARDDGAVPGRYRVTIAKYEGPPESAAAPGPSGPQTGGEEEYSEDYQEDAPAPPPSKNILPPRYASPDTSGFEVEVVEGENTFDFALEGP